MSLVIDKEKEVELIMVISGASINTKASFRPPISLSQPRIVPLFLSYRYLLLERDISIVYFGSYFPNS